MWQTSTSFRDGALSMSAFIRGCGTEQFRRQVDAVARLDGLDRLLRALRFGCGTCGASSLWFDYFLSQSAGRV